MDKEIKEAIKACAVARVELTSFYRTHRETDYPDERAWADLAGNARAHILAAEEMLWRGIDPSVEGEVEGSG